MRATIRIFFPFAMMLSSLTLFAQNTVHITLQPQEKREPISPYIYGQFIEHLGKCVYEGMWSEMISDRKFMRPIEDLYNPWGVGNDEFWGSGPFEVLARSPWKVVGPPGTVKMDAVASYVGKLTPVIQLPGGGQEAGIAQHRMGFTGKVALTGHIVLSGTQSAAPVTIRLREGREILASTTVSGFGGDFESLPFTLNPVKGSPNAWLEIVSKGTGSFKVGTVSMMPMDNVHGWRSDTLALLKQLDAPIYRWPGGNFVSGYDWRDGVGPRDKRPPRANPAWSGIESNDVGIHEYMELMELIDAEPFIAVNTGNGTVASAAAEVEYLNGGADTELGKLRAAHGHPEPWGVKWFAVGNEMYGSWQIGHVPLDQYVDRHNSFAEAMWKADPSIKLVGVGNMGEWTTGMLENCAQNMNLISEHIYRKGSPNILSHTGQLAADIRARAEAHRRYRNEIGGLAERDIRIAMDEWNYWYGPYVYGELGVQYHMKDALGIARGLHEYFRNSDLFFMANYAQTVNVIGAIKTSPTDAIFDATGLVLKLYRGEFGTHPIPLNGDTGDLDISAAWTADRRGATVAVVNPMPDTRTVVVDWGTTKLAPGAKIWTIANPDPMAFNAPDSPQQVLLRYSTDSVGGKSIIVPPMGIVLYRYELLP